MNNPFIKAIHSVSPLSEEAQEALQAVIRFEPMKRHADLLKTGQVSYYMYFIAKGLARVYYYHDEKDVTTYFAMDHEFIGGVESLFTGQPSKKGIHLLEDSDVYAIKYRDFEKLCAQFHDIERAGRKLATYAFLIGQERIESMRFYEARQRYDELEKKYPGISNRAPLKYIASYLGIAQVSLSRIRAAV